jgi:hypothetical protein
MINLSRKVRLADLDRVVATAAGSGLHVTVVPHGLVSHGLVSHGLVSHGLVPDAPGPSCPDANSPGTNSPGTNDALAAVPAPNGVVGAAAVVPLVVDAAAYRIVQESITNVLWHSESAEAVVEVDYLPTEIRLRISNTAAGQAVPGVRAVPSGPQDPASAGGGFGIAGMRERVELLGGTFSVEPTSAGGFEVSAVLPFPVPSASPM